MARREKKECSITIRLPGRLREALAAEAKLLDRKTTYIVMRMLEARYPAPTDKDE